MLSNAAHFLVGSATLSLLLLASAPARAQAQACGDISDAAMDLVDAGSAAANGAPFFTLAQKAAFGYSTTDIAVIWGSPSPSSALYYSNFAAGHDLTQIADVDDVLAGDVMIINAAGSYSGHTAVVIGAPVEIAPGFNPIFANTRQWALPIADSTSSVHGCSITYPDSRWSGTCGTGSFTAGVGTGYIRLYTDLAGGLLGYSWSVTSGATYYSPSTRPYAIARLNPCPPL